MLKKCLFFLCCAAAPLFSNTLEPIAELQFWPTFALFVQDSNSSQIAYSQPSMSICEEPEPAQKSSSLGSKASFATGSLELSGNHLDEPLMQKLISLFHVETLVETGTFEGGTAALASRHFKEVHTIELAHKLFKKASKLVKNIPNVHCYEGHSGDVIAVIGPKLKGKTLFWLDAHYSGGSTAKGASNSAIRDEIAAIKKSGLKNSIILIDDIRGFQGKPEKVAFFGGYPSIKELKELLLTINPEYEFWVLGDMAIAYPKTENVAVSPLVKACTLSRSFDGQEMDIQAVIEEEEQFKNQAKLQETGAIDALYNAYFVQMKETTNITHYLVWEGLVSSGKGEFSKAIDCLSKAISYGYDHWRVYWYLANAQYANQDLANAKLSLEKVAQAAPDFKQAQELSSQISKLSKSGCECETSCVCNSGKMEACGCAASCPCTSGKVGSCTK